MTNKGVCVPTRPGLETDRVDDASNMVSPTINRVKGKTLEQRKRDRKRMGKANAKQAGKIVKSPARGVKDRAPGKKQLKKKEQRARLLVKGTAGGSSKPAKMEL